MASRPGDWEGDRVRTAYLEARAVIEAQNETMATIDTKAIRTVRFNVLLIGLMLTALQVAGRGTFQPNLLVAAIGSITASVVLGTLTFNESNLFVGPGDAYFDGVVTGDVPVSGWDRHLVRAFSGMVSENADELSWNSWLLTTSQGTMLVGVILVVTSILIG